MDEEKFKDPAQGADTPQGSQSSGMDVEFENKNSQKK